MTGRSAWWHAHLAAEERTLLLHSLYTKNADSASPLAASTDTDFNGRFDGEFTAPRRSRRHQWAMRGQDVWRVAFCTLLGIGRNCLQKSAHGIPRHLDEPRCREAPQRDRVHQFFLELYMSAAESMPHDSDYIVEGRADSSLMLIRTHGATGRLSPSLPALRLTTQQTVTMRRKCWTFGTQIAL